MDDHIPFTPPPHYVPAKNLPRSRREPETHQPIVQDYGGSSVSRKQSITRRVSNRVQKSTKQKRKPGLSIDTSVTRHKAEPPQEIKNPPSQVAAIAVATSPQPWQSTQPAAYQPSGQSYNIPAPLNSPSRFPASFVDASKRNTLRPSPGPKDLYFAPPPGTLSKRSSSVYSKATRASSIKENYHRQKSLKQKPFNGSSTRRSSTATAFEVDISQLQRNRIASGGTVFEEHGMSARPPSTAYTITPHRSRGWWNFITTPFESKPGMALEYRSPNDGDKTPAVPLIPKEYMNSAASPSKKQSRIKSNVSTWSAFSPNDREIPIMLESGIHRHYSVEGPNVRNQHLSPSTAGSVVNRMPFADMGKTPPSGMDEFSPVGMVAGQGSVGGTTTVVNINMVTGPPQAQSTEVFSIEDTPVTQNKRASFREAVNRTVRFITPHTSGAEASSQVASRSASDESIQVREMYNDPPQTPKQVRFASYNTDKEFSPPPTASKGTSLDYEEFEIDDKPQHKKKKKMNISGLLSFLTGGKKADKNKNGDDQKKEKKKMSKRRKICCMCCFCFLITGLLILILIITLAVTMSKKHKGRNPTQIVWTNLTNFPAMPSGALTLARPNLIANVSACVVPLTAWSCAVPKEQQAANSPNDPFQPNFLIDIFYDNSTSAPITNKRSTSGAAMANFLLNKRAQFTPSPGPPALAEQTFLGQTTDNNTAPFEGESTPFFISMLQPGSAAQRPTKVKRATQASPTVNTIPDLTSAIPPAAINPDGTPQPANLLPFPSFQPVRLYNRGRPDEHYGFYTYYDRNIFLRSNTIMASTEIIPADLNGGSTQTGANVRCTWRETRFLVQIWTKKGKLLPKASSGSKIDGGDYSQPGSFPYPATVTIDRHGGGSSTKMLYCYGIDVNGKVNLTAKQFQLEDRSFGGQLVNPNLGPFTAPNSTLPGTDGGSGGCSCSWQNWT